MAYSPTKAEQARVRGYVEKWAVRLKLNAVNINVGFSAKPNKEHPASAATCTSRTPYMEALITFWPIFWEESVEQQQRVVVHELLHVVLQPTKDVACDLHNGVFVTWKHVTDVNETATDALTNILWANR